MFKSELSDVVIMELPTVGLSLNVLGRLFETIRVMFAGGWCEWPWV
jgi:hypothetical protein